MRVARYYNEDLVKAIGTMLPSDGVTILHLGRGGVKQDGMLDDYNQERVELTLGLAFYLNTLAPHTPIQIIWSGGHNRKQDRSGVEHAHSEGGAALAHAQPQLDDPHKPITMRAEEKSTSTVENATASETLVPVDDTIIVVTDPLHYRFFKVQFIMWMVFPRRKIIYVELPKLPPGTTRKSVVKHFVSTFITVVGMVGVKRGNAPMIQRRQQLLQQLFHH